MKTRYAWLAGIVDGEGTITIARQRRFDYKSHPYSYRPEIHVTNTSNRMLAEVASILKTAVGRSVKIFPTNNGSNRPVYRVRLQDRKSCLNLIKLLFPYLIAKKPQAMLLMAFLKGDGRNSEIQAARIRGMNASSSNQEP